MSEWTDKHYSFQYKLTDKDKEAGEIRVDPYFVGMVWKTGSRDDSGALAHCLKTIARFGDKNSVEREIKALYAQVLGMARVHGVALESLQHKQFVKADSSHATQGVARNTGMVVQGSSVKPAESPWYPDDSGEWIEHSSREMPVDEDVLVEILFQDERDNKDWVSFPDVAWDWDWSDIDIVAYKVVG